MWDFHSAQPPHIIKFRLEKNMGIFTGKTAIITGGGKAKSIGYGIATAYAKEGANLVLTGRNEQKLNDLQEELESCSCRSFR